MLSIWEGGHRPVFGSVWIVLCLEGGICLVFWSVGIVMCLEVGHCMVVVMLGLVVLPCHAAGIVILP